MTGDHFEIIVQRVISSTVYWYFISLLFCRYPSRYIYNRIKRFFQTVLPDGNFSILSMISDEGEFQQLYIGSYCWIVENIQLRLIVWQLSTRIFPRYRIVKRQRKRNSTPFWSSTTHTNIGYLRILKQVMRFRITCWTIPQWSQRDHYLVHARIVKRSRN